MANENNLRLLKQKHNYKPVSPVTDKEALQCVIVFVSFVPTL